MATAHWVHSIQEHANGSSPVWGCQFTGCQSAALYQWQRGATAQEVSAEGALHGAYGQVVRNAQGPQCVIVFSCATHAPTSDAMTFTHSSTCPAPNPGCVCHVAP